MASRKKSPVATALLFDEVHPELAKEVCQWIIQQNMLPKSEQPALLNLIINSPGGELHSAFSIVEAIMASAIPVRSYSVGQVASSGLVIAMACKTGGRVITPTCSVLSHMFSAGSEGNYHQLMAIQREYEITNQRLMDHYKKFTSSTEKIISATLLSESDRYITPKEAMNLGLFDEIGPLRFE